MPARRSAQPRRRRRSDPSWPSAPPSARAPREVEQRVVHRVPLHRPPRAAPRRPGVRRRRDGNRGGCKSRTDARRASRRAARAGRPALTGKWPPRGRIQQSAVPSLRIRRTVASTWSFRCEQHTAPDLGSRPSRLATGGAGRRARRETRIRAAGPSLEPEDGLRTSPTVALQRTRREIYCRCPQS